MLAPGFGVQAGASYPVPAVPTDKKLTLGSDELGWATAAPGRFQVEDMPSVQLSGSPRTPKDAAQQAVPVSPRRREAAGIAFLAVALFVSLATLSLLVGDGTWMGPAGAYVARALYVWFGLGVVGPAVLFFSLALRFFRAPRPASSLKKIASSVALWLLSMMFLQLVGARPLNLPLGGALGEYALEAFLSLLGLWGTVLLLGMSLLTVVVLLTPLTVQAMVVKTRDAARLVAQKMVAVFAARLPVKRPLEKTPTIPNSGKPCSGVPRVLRDYGDDRDEQVDVSSQQPAQSGGPVIVSRRKADEMGDGGVCGQPTVAKPGFAKEATKKILNKLRSEDVPTHEPVIVVSQNAERDDATVKMDGPPSHMPLPVSENEADVQPAIEFSDESNESDDDIVEANTPVPRQKRLNQANYIELRPYQAPPIDLFDFAEVPQHEFDRKAMLDLAQRLEGTLTDYTVKGRVAAIHPGPVVTMYEFVPAPGIKLSRITSLSNDLAMALEALRVRIVAPIPGKAAVGIEVPNRTRETVYLKEILSDETFRQAKSKLTMALGKDISGTPVSVDLAKMPHLLVAGTTGSGKSVSVNAMVCSLLMNASPDEVKMIMIDPKMLELSIYEGIPHLLLPVVTDPKKAALALRWAVEEMDRRYDLISKSFVRDIGGYNKKIEKQLETAPSGQLSLHVEEDNPPEPDEGPPRKLPFIVVLIDEFADLMMVAGKEVEICVARIAQKARAAGIHLILATQRPSVDVITGLIKANFPSRIAFQVASRVDSRTILDQQGAEHLLGMGDMLFTDRGQALRRIHGALITDGEVHRVVEHLKQLGKPIYDMDILKPRGEDGEEAAEEEPVDELYDQAVRIVSEGRQISISMLQRKMRIGYNRSARMIERMERDGIVGAADGAKGIREVLILAQ